MLTFVGRHPRQVAASIPSSHARHVLLSVVMSASQQLEALVCYRKDRTAPAISLLQQVRRLSSLKVTASCRFHRAVMMLAIADEPATC